LALWHLLDFVGNLMSFFEQMWRFLDTVVQNQASPDSPAMPGMPGKVVLGRCSDPMATRAWG